MTRSDTPLGGTSMPYNGGTLSFVPMPIATMLGQQMHSNEIIWNPRPVLSQSNGRNYPM